MKAWRQLTVGNHVHARTATKRVICAQVAPVPEAWRDETGSHATTTRGDFPKVWLQIADGDPVPFPVRSVSWPNHLPSTSRCRR